MLTDPGGQFRLLTSAAGNQDLWTGSGDDIHLTNMPEWAKKMFGVYSPDPFGILSPFLNDLFGFQGTPAVSAPVAMLRDENGEWIYALRGQLRGDTIGDTGEFSGMAGAFDDAPREVGVVHAVAFYNLTQNRFVGEDPAKYVEEPDWEPTGGMGDAGGPPIRYDAPGPVDVPLVTLPVMDQGYLSYNVRGTNIMILPAYEGTPTGGGKMLSGSDLTVWGTSDRRRLHRGGGRCTYRRCARIWAQRWRIRRTAARIYGRRSNIAADLFG